MIQKVAQLFLAVALMLCLVVTPTLADATVQDGLEASLELDKAEYDEFDVLDVTLKVKNCNAFAVNNVTLDVAIPNGYSLEEGYSNTQTVGRLNTGATSQLHLKLRNNEAVVPDVPQTGDDSPIFLWMTLVVASAIGLVFITSRKKGGRFLSLLLCFALIGTGVVMPVQGHAQTAEIRSLTVQDTASVNGHNLTVQGLSSILRSCLIPARNGSTSS